MRSISILGGASLGTLNFSLCFSAGSCISIPTEVLLICDHFQNYLDLVVKRGFHMVVTVVKIESRSFSSAEIQHFRTRKIRGVIITREYLFDLYMWFTGINYYKLAVQKDVKDDVHDHWHYDYMETLDRNLYDMGRQRLNEIHNILFYK